jgi:3-(3-hydroxy-phenyl)propionate hydroxylase
VTEHYDVAVVGFGPVGALSALQLAEAGLRVAVLERSQEPVVLPRAVGLDGESVRSFQRLGRAAPVEAILQPRREGEAVCFTDSKRNEYFAMPMPERGVNGYRDIAFFDQPELEAMLRDFVSEQPNVDVFLGRELAELQQDPEGVTLRDAAGQELRADFVIGSDGASSFVRGAVGIDWLSLGYDQDWLVIDILQGADAKLPLRTMQVCDPERLTTYVCVKDPNRRWEFQLVEGETREEMLRPERIAELLDPWLPRDQYELRRAAVYQFHAATADRWQEGRVLLAGDSAHQTPPFLGQGLNAGFRDAVNLGWKLPLVQAGICEPSLLATYEAERDAHARDLVEWAVAIGKLMETFAAREAGLPDPHVADESSGYGQGRTAPPLRDGALIAEQVGDDSSTGMLFAQPSVIDEAGVEQMFDELLGRGFAVVGRDAAALEMSAGSRAILERLGAQAVALEGLEIVEGSIDRLFTDHPAAIVRPDRYVFGVVDAAHDLDALVQELARKISLRS